jgi:hypothetical protein
MATPAPVAPTSAPTANPKQFAGKIPVKTWPKTPTQIGRTQGFMRRFDMYWEMTFLTENTFTLQDAPGYPEFTIVERYIRWKSAEENRYKVKYTYVNMEGKPIEGETYVYLWRKQKTSRSKPMKAKLRHHSK